MLLLSTTVWIYKVLISENYIIQDSPTFPIGIVPVTCAKSQFSFAHEVGHIMSAEHNSPGTVENDLGFGYQIQGLNKVFRTLLS